VWVNLRLVRVARPGADHETTLEFSENHTIAVSMAPAEVGELLFKCFDEEND
jgi:hypothetical protein